MHVAHMYGLYVCIHMYLEQMPSRPVYDKVL